MVLALFFYLKIYEIIEMRYHNLSSEQSISSPLFYKSIQFEDFVLDYLEGYL